MWWLLLLFGLVLGAGYFARYYRPPVRRVYAVRTSPTAQYSGLPPYVRALITCSNKYRRSALIHCPKLDEIARRRFQTMSKVGWRITHYGFHRDVSFPASEVYYHYSAVFANCEFLRRTAPYHFVKHLSYRYFGYAVGKGGIYYCPPNVKELIGEVDVTRLGCKVEIGDVMLFIFSNYCPQ
ncbi:MAG: hypothetical protein OWQ51_03335 [Pyrobaculum arsenaticum]|uniref:hypothetical protein n=1 Tax=Pyrobaculum arsenaticum TaxID=121277 RepID=UPI002275C8D9|nr:hypothetical protein [Pyrobaculum arsenaticum]